MPQDAPAPGYGPTLLPAWLAYLPPALAPRFFRTQARRVESASVMNLTISNVPGPRQTLYAVGAELLNIFPVSIATHGLALNITVQSYRDQLDFGFIAGANIIPHVQVLCDMLPGEFAALQAAFAPPGDIKSAAS